MTVTATRADTSTRKEASNVISIGNICLVEKPSDLTKSREYANKSRMGRREVTDNDIRALSPSNRKKLVNFLYNEWKTHDSDYRYGWFWIVGAHGPLVVAGDYGVWDRLFASDRRAVDVASLVAYIEVTSEPAAPQITGHLRS